MFNIKIKKFYFSRIIVLLSILLIFPQGGYAQSVANLPVPGTVLTLSPKYDPAILAGITIYPDNPLVIDFIVDVGDDNLKGEALQVETEKLVSYFMASLTVPEDEMWVNLSPYEKNRIIADGLGQTVLGRDMLAQDYLLKQLTASMMYPDNDLGDGFWQKIYEKAQDKFGTTEIPTNMFSKIWIVPEEAVVYSKERNVFVVNSYLKVMLEEDYLSLEHHDKELDSKAADALLSQETKSLMREIIVPEIEKEVNEGKNFSPLRQMFHSMILATWYKKNLKESVLKEVYIDQNKVEGIDIEDKDVKNKIYQQYVESFKKGVYDHIREEYDAQAQEIIPRKYFLGGVDAGMLGKKTTSSENISPDSWIYRRIESDKVIVKTNLTFNSSLPLKGDSYDRDFAMVAQKAEMLSLEELQKLETFNEGEIEYDTDSIIEESGFEDNDDLVDAKWIYRGMRLTLESLNEILLNGMKVSEHYGNSAFMTRLELAVSKALWPERRPRQDIPIENYHAVVFQVDLEEIKKKMGSSFEPHSTSSNKAMSKILGVEYDAWDTISPDILKKVWVLDKVTSKYVLLDIALPEGAKDSAMLNPGGIDFNSGNLDLKTKGDTLRFNTPINLQGLESQDIRGVVPEIISIVPFRDFQGLLGLLN